MKLFFSPVLLLLANSIYSQQISLEAGPSNGSLNTKWDLSKNVWSQTHNLIGNKPPLDYGAIDSWNYLDNSKLLLSSDGRYFAFGKYKGDRFSRRDEIMTIESTTDNWQKTFPSKSNGFFSIDNKQYIFQDDEGLNFVQLGTDQIRSRKHVKSFKHYTNNSADWIAYQMNNIEADLVLQNLISGKETKIDNITDFDFDRSGKWMACKVKSENKQLLLHNLTSGEEKYIFNVDSYVFSNNGESMLFKVVVDNKIEIKYLALISGEAYTVWSATEKYPQVINYGLDETGKQVVFTVKSFSNALDDKGNGSNSIWYYKLGMNKAELKVDNLAKGIANGLHIRESSSFTENGRYIQFELEETQASFQPDSDAIMVDVWNHKDNILQSTQFLVKNAANIYKAVISTESDEIIRLEKENENLSLLKGNFAIVHKDHRVGTDRFWEVKDKKDSIWLFSLINGDRQLLPITKALTSSFWFSPEGKYLVYLDLVNGSHYFSLDLITGKKNKISSGIPDWKLGHESLFNRPLEKPDIGCGIVGWLKEDSAVLVYDDYDIWQLDLTGNGAPVCVTRGYGRQHKILLSLLNNDRMYGDPNMVFHSNDTLLLTGFNTKNKYTVFYQVPLGLGKEPELLSEGPFFYFDLPWTVDMGFSYGIKPVCASRSNTWIVQRESAIEAPNYFVTHDFKSFKPLTNFQTQKSYNWLKSELHSFQQLDGSVSQGVLYKPENFDPSKKYPVIISFYTQSSGALYQFTGPKYIECAEIIGNHAWMVSQGYLVFFPDIYFTKGQWGPSVVNSVVGAVNYLKGLPFVDSKHIGACGHSNGGRMGYYLFTHSNCFAAMSVGSGTTDIISNGLKMVNDGLSDGTSSMEWAENGFPNGGIGELWKSKSTWIDHASVLHADKAVCPLLIFQNKKDPSYMQGFEMFTSLRRLGKPNWWLQYDKGNHRLNYPGGENINELKDYTIRYTQYWDHFLKGAPAPRWMIEGIPYELKGIESALDLNAAGNCGSVDKPCVICAAWNTQYKRNPAMFAKPISEWKLDGDIQNEMDKKESLIYKQNMSETERCKELNNRKLNEMRK